MLIPIKEVLTVEASKPYTYSQTTTTTTMMMMMMTMMMTMMMMMVTMKQPTMMILMMMMMMIKMRSTYEESMDGARSVTLHSPSLPGPQLQEAAKNLKKKNLDNKKGRKPKYETN